MSPENVQRRPVGRFVEGAVSALTMVAAIVFLASAGGYFFSPVQGTDAPRTGVPVNLTGVDWASNRLTLIIALQTDCVQCEASMPFYRDLIASNRQGAFQPLVVVPHSKTIGESLLTAAGLAVPEVRQADFAKLRIPGTPSLILVDNSGVVRKVWVGRLSPVREDAVFDRLKVKRLFRSPHIAGDSRPEGSVTAKDFSRGWREKVVLDTRPREEFRASHIAGALNIPLEELETRVLHEVPVHREIVVVCDYLPTCPVLMQGEGGTSVCDAAVESIKNKGFRAVQVLDEGLTSLEAFGIPLIRG